LLFFSSPKKLEKKEYVLKRRQQNIIMISKWFQNDIIKNHFLITF